MYAWMHSEADVDLDGENLKLHIFLDRSVAEAFANYKKS
jgi:hypothetical protein